MSPWQVSRQGKGSLLMVCVGLLSLEVFYTDIGPALTTQHGKRLDLALTAPGSRFNPELLCGFYLFIYFFCGGWHGYAKFPCGVNECVYACCVLQ